MATSLTQIEAGGKIQRKNSNINPSPIVIRICVNWWLYVRNKMMGRFYGHNKALLFLFVLGIQFAIGESRSREIDFL